MNQEHALHAAAKFEALHRHVTEFERLASAFAGAMSIAIVGGAVVDRERLVNAIAEALKPAAEFGAATSIFAADLAAERSAAEAAEASALWQQVQRATGDDPIQLACLVMRLFENGLAPALRLRDRYAARLNSDTTDGPRPPNKMRWEGIETDVEPKPWALINHLWNRKNDTVESTEVAVWGEESETDDRLKTAIRKANRALEEVACPYRMRKKKQYLTLG